MAIVKADDEAVLDAKIEYLNAKIESLDAKIKANEVIASAIESLYAVEKVICGDEVVLRGALARAIHEMYCYAKRL